MIRVIADNIMSPLGLTTGENLQAILRGESQLRVRRGLFGLPEDFCGSVFDRDMVPEIADTQANDGGFSFFERLCIASAAKAVAQSGIDPAAEDVIFVISTTKGNVDAISRDLMAPEAYIGESARRIAGYFGCSNSLVTSNACISGVCAQIAGVRALLGGRFRYAVIVGADVLSRFIVSGFQSFKALSPEPCRPYDAERCGLNLGEAAGTIILERCDDSDADQSTWQFVACSNHNDANHISGPSRTGEGSFRVLRDLLAALPADRLAFVNAHGTATLYNDEMESIALDRAGLAATPVNALKGFYGHTLGAAGIIETILSMHAVDNGIVLPTRGFASQGTSHRLNVSADVRPTYCRAFFKILSGFGGSNAGIAYRKGGDR